MNKDELFQLLKERITQLRHDINVQLNCKLNVREDSYWHAFADGVQAVIENTRISQEIQREDLQRTLKLGSRKNWPSRE